MWLKVTSKNNNTTKTVFNLWLFNLFSFGLSSAAMLTFTSKPWNASWGRQWQKTHVTNVQLFNECFLYFNDCLAIYWMSVSRRERSLKPVNRLLVFKGNSAPKPSDRVIVSDKVCQDLGLVSLYGVGFNSCAGVCFFFVLEKDAPIPPTDTSHRLIHSRRSATFASESLK